MAYIYLNLQFRLSARDFLQPEIPRVRGISGRKSTSQTFAGEKMRKISVLCKTLRSLPGTCRAIIPARRARFILLSFTHETPIARRESIYALHALAHHFDNCRHFLIKIHSAGIASPCVTGGVHFYTAASLWSTESLPRISRK